MSLSLKKNRAGRPSKTLTPEFRMLLLEAARHAGSYDPAKALPFVEERMTEPQTQLALAFLAWVHASGKTFGGGNLDAVYAEFRNSRAA